MPVIPLNLPWEPDKGGMSPTALDTVLNAMPLPEGWGPLSLPTEYSQALPSPCKGAWWFRNDAGVFSTVAATQTKLYRLGTGDLSWTDISKVGAEMATNGAFASDTGWTKGTGITIAGGKAVFSSVANGQRLSQANTFVNGVTYKVTFTVSTYIAGYVTAVLTGGGEIASTPQSGNGTVTVYLISTNNTGFALNASTGGGDPVSLQIDDVSIAPIGSYTGPNDGELWTAALFGQNFYVTNINDPLQVSVNGGTFVDAPGSPPQGKYVATVGDFLFLGNLKVGGSNYPRSWQHSKINDPTNWVVDGAPGASDGQDIADGDDIVAILSSSGSGARIIQKRARRALIFTPGSATAFSQTDIDGRRGAAAPHSVVSLGSTDYFFLTENGFVMNDAYTPIGAERIDGWFLAHVDPARLFAVKAAADPSKKIVWVTYEDQVGTQRIVGYNWFLDRWFQSDEAVDLFVATVSPGYVLDDLTGVLDDYPTPPLDSSFWFGGRLSFAAFKGDGKMYLFAGNKAAAVIETPTLELAEGMGAYVFGASLLGNLEGFTLQHGTAFTPDRTLSWSPSQTPSSITGICPFSKDAKWHRFRVTVATGGTGTHVHGIRPHARPSTQA